MSLHFLNPDDEPRACPACRGDGIGARINAGIPAGRTGGPGLVELVPDGCRVCNGSGRLGNPDAQPEIDVRCNEIGRYYALPGPGWTGRRLPGLMRRGYDTEAAALAAAREAAR